MKKLLILPMIAIALLISNCGGDDGDSTPKSKLAVGDVAETNTSFVVKFSGSRCPPCGSWGWSMMSDLIGGTGDDAISMTAYGQNFVAQLFITGEATTLQTDWGAKGYPHFGANGSVTTIARNGGVNTTAEKQEIFDRVSAHKSAGVVANTGLNYEIVDGNINMEYKTKAFKALSGENYLAVYILEHEVVGAQSGHPETPNTKHKHILRKEVTGSAYGTNIGTLAANGTYEGEVTYPVGSDWNTDNIEIVTVLYTKNGSKYDFVNASRGVLVP